MLATYWSPMRIDGVGIRELALRLKVPFETSFGTMWEWRVLLVEVHFDGVTGWGEITAGAGPFYHAETVGTSWMIFGEFITPLVVGKRLAAATGVAALLQPIRGREMTKVGFETALWDVEAQQKGTALAKLLRGMSKKFRSRLKSNPAKTWNLLPPCGNTLAV